MQGSLYVALSSQIALERRMNTLADNVANANTTGFRATEVKFNEVLAEYRIGQCLLRQPGRGFPVVHRMAGLKHHRQPA
jgi:flagellar basal-body rod protein FlgF